jgi:hypothetical protein
MDRRGGARARQPPPGKLADFVLLTDDVAAVEPDRIGAVGVVATFVGGRCVHGGSALGLDKERE